MRFLVIVDMQNDFITGSLGSPEAVVAKDNLVEKLKQEDEDTVIIFTMDTHYDVSYLRTLEGKKLPVKHCIAHTDGWNIEEEVFKFGSYQRVFDTITKNTFGSINALALAINSFDIKNFEIEICGLCTDICVVSNALILRATFPNTVIKVDSKCCAGTTPANHEAALTVMKSCQIEVI